MRTSQAGRRRRNSQRGFTYVVVLAALVVVGIVAEVAQVATWRALRADREAELLFRGKAYQSAIASFHQSNGAFPRALEDLEKDPRSPAKRHIRALYRDPLSKDEKGEWRLVRATDGGIAGVSSSSREEPLKQANFAAEFERFTGAKSYSEWIFEYTPVPVGATKKPAAAPVVKKL
jgi:type II secretory pathway pseudopilin PulG